MSGKDPDDRWQSAHDLAAALLPVDHGSGVPGGGGGAGRAATQDPRANRLGGLGVLALIVAVGSGIALWTIYETPQVVRSSLLPPDGARFEPRYGAMALSPDGTRLVFLASDEGSTRVLWVRSLSALTAQPLAGTEGAIIPSGRPTAVSSASSPTESSARSMPLAARPSRCARHG